MKIKTIDTNTKQPAKNLRIQLQVKGKDSGFLTLTSDAQGHIILDEKYKGQQIAFSGQSNYIPATDGATLMINPKAQQQNHQHQQMAGNKNGAHGNPKEKNKETWK